MAEKPAKKAAAKKAAAAPKKSALGDFPLPDQHYFYYPDVLTDFAHKGGAGPEEESVLAVQRLLGVPETGQFDSVTANEVARWRVEHDLPYAPLLDAETWAKMASA